MSPDLSPTDLRLWLRRLYTEPAWGWTKGKRELARYLGFRGETPHRDLWSKVRGGPIYPAEHERLSKRIDDILAGRVVLRHVYHEQGHQMVWRAVYAENPVPLRPAIPQRPQALQMRVEIGRQGIRLRLA